MIYTPYKITAFYEDDYEAIKSLRKMTEAREIFWFLFDDKKPVKGLAKMTFAEFKSALLKHLDNEQQNAVAYILAQIKESSYTYDKVKCKDIENSMSITGQMLQAHSIVNTTKLLIDSLSEE
jgi:hypothetical protein